MNNHYVYVCYVNNVAKYVGMGKGSRFKHCTSGKSSCAQLNRDFFNEDKMSTVIVEEGLTRDDALLRESFIISEIGIENLYNISEGKVDDLLGRSLSLITDLHNKITMHDQIGFNDVKGLALGMALKYDNPIQDILNRNKITKLLSLFGYSYKSGVFTKFKEANAMQVSSYLKGKLIRA